MTMNKNFPIQFAYSAGFFVGVEFSSFCNGCFCSALRFWLGAPWLAYIRMLTGSSFNGILLDIGTSFDSSHLLPSGWALFKAARWSDGLFFLNAPGIMSFSWFSRFFGSITTLQPGVFNAPNFSSILLMWHSSSCKSMKLISTLGFKLWLETVLIVFDERNWNYIKICLVLPEGQ